MNEIACRCLELGVKLDKVLVGFKQVSGAKLTHVHSSDVAQALTYLVCGDRSEPLEDLRDLRLGRARGGHDDAGEKDLSHFLIVAENSNSKDANR